MHYLVSNKLHLAQTFSTELLLHVSYGCIAFESGALPQASGLRKILVQSDVTWTLRATRLHVHPVMTRSGSSRVPTSLQDFTVSDLAFPRSNELGRCEAVATRV